MPILNLRRKRDSCRTHLRGTRSCRRRLRHERNYRSPHMQRGVAIVVISRYRRTYQPVWDEWPR